MNPCECIFCLENYNCEDRRPHCLTCGHSFCSSCLRDLLKHKPLICPHCRVPHRVQTDSVDDVPVNYALMSLLEGRTRETLHRDDVIRSLKNETKERTSVKKVAIQSQIKTLRIRLRDLKGHANSSAKMQKEFAQLMKCLENIQSLVKKEIESVQEAIDDALKLSKCLMDSQKTLKESTSLLETASAEEKAIRFIENAEPFLHRNQTLISSKVLENSRKIHSQCRTFLAKVKGLMAEPEPAPLPVPPQTSLLKTKVLKGNVTLPMVEEALKRDRSMWVVTTLEGRPRRAQIVKDGSGRLLLHAFQDGEPPAGSTVAELESLCQLGENGVFLEVSWGGERRGKVFIGMEGKGKHGEAVLFKHLCLGVRGPSYANTHFKQKVDTPFTSSVLCGWSERDDGRKDLISHLKRDCQRCDSNVVEGTVLLRDMNDLSCFLIYTVIKIPIPRDKYPTVGCVEDGLALVKEALDLPDITKVTVTDSGLDLGLWNPLTAVTGITS